jgi:hypothetical protein
MKLAAALLLLLAGIASPDIRYFRYERPVQNLGQQSGQICVRLDSGIFANGSAALADLRLYHDQTETPYVIRTAQAVEGSEKSIEPVNLGTQSGHTVFDAELPGAHYSDMQLDVAAKDFIATVTVSGSSEKAKSAETRLGTFTIFDLTRQKLGRSTMLHLPVSDFSHLHFSIAGPLVPGDITGLSIEHLPSLEPAYLTVAESAQVTEKDHSTILQFRVPAHVPVDRVVFVPGTRPAFFSRDVSIQVSPVEVTQDKPAPGSDEAVPRTAAASSGNLLRVHREQDGHRLDEERLAIDAPQVDFETTAQWTITIDNGDDAPLPLTAVKLEMLERTLCFDASAGTQYTLYYGNPALGSPRYDYATLFAPQANAAAAMLGPEQPNPVYEAPPDDRPFTERHPALMWVALIAVIALLGGVALRTGSASSSKNS